MGSCDPGTMCAYCDAEEAGYIPDGCVGPMCGSCMDWAAVGGRPEMLRLQRRARSLLTLCPGHLSSGVTPSFATVIFHDERLSLVIVRWLIWL